MFSFLYNLPVNALHAERTQNEDRILHVNIPFYVSSDARQRFVPKKFNMYNSFLKLKKYKISIKLSLFPFRYLLKSR